MNQQKACRILGITEFIGEAVLKIPAGKYKHADRKIAEEIPSCSRRIQFLTTNTKNSTFK